MIPANLLHFEDCDHDPDPKGWCRKCNRCCDPQSEQYGQRPASVEDFDQRRDGE